MKEPPDAETIKKLINLLGVEARDLLRSHEQVFKDAGLDESDLPENEIIEAIEQCPTLLQTTHCGH